MAGTDDLDLGRVGMVEQVAGKVNEEDAMRSMKRMQEGKFDFTDNGNFIFLGQIS